MEGYETRLNTPGRSLGNQRSNHWILVTLTALVYVVMANRGNLRIDRPLLSALVYVAFAANVFGDIAYFLALTR